jgi:hypothetical protein
VIANTRIHSATITASTATNSACSTWLAPAATTAGIANVSVAPDVSSAAAARGIASAAAGVSGA